MANLTIADKEFEIAPRYVAGHPLTEGEASALNQTFFENIRNNMAKKVKEGKASQDEITAYASEYQFGVRSLGTSTRLDAVAREMLSLIKKDVRAALKTKGQEASAETVTSFAERIVSNTEHPKYAVYRSKAERIVATIREDADADMDSLLAA
jgi:ATP-dependent protease HslVU (ClpYQ) ATPase subunit